MKTVNTTNTDILLKSIDLELKALLKADLQNHKNKKNGINQGAKQAA